MDSCYEDDNEGKESLLRAERRAHYEEELDVLFKALSEEAKDDIISFALAQLDCERTKAHPHNPHPKVG